MGTSRWISQNLNNKNTQYIYFGLWVHHQELHETEHFCDSYLEVPLISMNMYHLELTPESYNLKKVLAYLEKMFSSHISLFSKNLTKHFRFLTIKKNKNFKTLLSSQEIMNLSWTFRPFQSDIIIDPWASTALKKFIKFNL